MSERSGCYVTLHCCLRYVFLCFSFHAAPFWWETGFSAWSVPFHTISCDRRGRQAIKIAHATGSRVNIHRHISIFVFREFGVITGSARIWTGWVYGWKRARWEWQETGQEFRCVSGNRRIGQQDDEGGEEPLRGHGGVLAVSSRRGVRIFYFHFNHLI